LLAKHSKLKITKKGEFVEYLDNTLQGVMEKLGDNNARNKEQAENAMRMMGDHPSIQPPIIVTHLIKGNTLKPKLDNSIKHITGRLFMLHELVK
jgi:hypothetical protein